MSTSTIPAPKFNFLFASTSLTGITPNSSRWQALTAFLASAEGALVSRLRELPNGFIFGSIAESVGKRAMEKDTSWKSPRAGLSHCAWKSARATDFHFYHSPGDGELSFRSDSGKK
jgi:hypothetical protein